MATTLKTILAEARAVVPEEGPLDVQRRLASGGQTVLIDVRDPDEYRDGYIEPATNVSRGFLEFRVGSVLAIPRRRSFSTVRRGCARCSPPRRSRTSATATS